MKRYVKTSENTSPFSIEEFDKYIHLIPKTARTIEDVFKDIESFLKSDATYNRINNQYDVLISSINALQSYLEQTELVVEQAIDNKKQKVKDIHYGEF